MSSSQNTTIQLPTPTKGEANILEEQILELSGFRLNQDIHIFDVPINFEGPNYIHTYKLGDENKETLVLIHGYAGCSLLFHRMLKDLAKDFRVFCIDLLGMGLSSKPEFKCNSTEETINYFVDSIEMWREAMNLETFYLAGHSFGAYMGTHYALKHESKVKKLFLLSPVGLTNYPVIPIKKPDQNASWLKKKIQRLTLNFWATFTTIGEFYRDHPYIAGFFLKRYFSKEFGSDGNQHFVQLIHKFYCALYSIEGGSDKALYYILTPPKANAIVPLEGLIMDSLKVPIVCYFGDSDWVDKTGAYRIQSSGEKKFRVKEITKSNHQITMHNPQQLSQDILEEMAN